MPARRKNTRVLLFDRSFKAKQFKEHLKTARTITVVWSRDIKEAFEKAKQRKFDYVVLGGDLVGNFDAAVLLKLLLDHRLIKQKNIFITTWDEKEAEALRVMAPKAFRIPFSRLVARALMKKNQIRRANLNRIEKNREERV